jgi:hypothetical protein
MTGWFPNARGPNAAHKLGIIHRDLKPDNIFLTRGDDESIGGSADLFSRSAALRSDQGEKPQTLGNRSALPRSPVGITVKIVDFGIAKLRESATHTQTGMVLGTPAYMSFEQASGMKSDQLDARSDVYSLGVVVYEMLTGRVPFQSDTPVGYLRMHLQDAPPPFHAVNPTVPALAEVESVVMKTLTKDRDQRYASALEFAGAFSEAAELAPAPTVNQLLPSTKGVRPAAVFPREPKVTVQQGQVEENPLPSEHVPITDLSPRTTQSTGAGNHATLGPIALRRRPGKLSAIVVFLCEPRHTRSVNLCLLACMLVLGGLGPVDVLITLSAGLALIKTSRYVRQLADKSPQARQTPPAWLVVLLVIPFLLPFLIPLLLMVSGSADFSVHFGFAIVNLIGLSVVGLRLRLRPCMWAARFSFLLVAIPIFFEGIWYFSKQGG